MGRKRSIFHNALMLTGVNLLLRLVSTSFQVFISGHIGAGGVGLLQLVLSVGSMAMTAGMAGIRTSTMYLTAEELGKNRAGNVTWILSGCIGYSVVFSVCVGAGVNVFAPQIAQSWIGDLRTVGAIRLFAAFLPISCLSGVMCGYFTAANRIGTLAAVEVAEQVCSMAVTACALIFWAGEDIGRACRAVVLGGCVGACLTVCVLVALRLAEKPKTGARIRVARRLTSIALPLALADDLKVGINTTENLMVPKRLALYGGTADALAQFGTVCGMVFPVLMFPAAILYGLADLLIPEMARCNAAQSEMRIRYLTRRSLRLALFYGAACGGSLYLLAEPLCDALYKSADAARYLRMFALLAPMLYTDAVVDAINKGLGKQNVCVKINILTSVMDVVGLYFLLPRYGMEGYFASFVLTHAVNAALSLALLLKITKISVPVRVPIVTALTMVLTVMAAQFVPSPLGKAAAFAAMLPTGLYLTGVLRREDVRWLVGLLATEKSGKKSDFCKNNI